MDRFVARIPLALLVAPLLLVVWAGPIQHGQGGLLLAGLPTALALAAYARAGVSSRRRGGS